MKKITILYLLLISTFSVFSQENKVEKDTTSSEINKLTIEFSAGQAKGLKPYTTGYFSSNNAKLFGDVTVNSYTLGVRYMLSPMFGLRADVGYANLLNNPKTTSLPFQMKVYSLGIQGVVNAYRLFNIEKPVGRFGLLIHGGVQVSQMKSFTANEMSKTVPTEVLRGHNNGSKELNGGLIVGFSPQLRLTNKIALISDVSVVSNFRQHFAWDGAFNPENNNLSGQLVSISVGLTYSLGNKKMHGDWAVIKDKKLEQIEAMQKRVEDVETLMNDTDKDGVPDYLDQENNSVTGVAVDTKGKMVDINRNGVPDELERYIENNTKEISRTTNADMIKRLINEGYIATYFDTGKLTPTNVSTEGIDFIRTYLRNNPSESVDIYGHADEIGSSDKNNLLSKARAEAVKSVLIKSGIDVSRLNVVSSGEDASVDVNSDEARKLVRRVTFRVKN